MTDISPEFIDNDLDPPSWASTGLIEQDPDAFAAGVMCADIEDGELIPRNEWRDMAAIAEPLLRGSVGVVLNQGREGSCVAAATTGAAMICGSLQFGNRMPLLSLMSLYERIGRSASSGAMIPDGVNEAAEHGILPADTIENRAAFDITYPMTGFNPRRLDRLEWEPVAKLFRVSVLKRINTVEGWFTALVSGFPIVYGRRGHAICSLMPVQRGNDWLFGYVNSWGSWGDELNGSVGRGLGWDTERTIRNCTGYAVQSIVRREGVAL